ncbi:response regulator transcription factor [Alkalihalobacillus deserti]|uniref:response regulator transcription factor n=1 Tax=Alkalihalobacillus deserti TaxID=2879466 RepID=UPI001D14D2CD|nr:response regulator [Alkalihalobacillus deserti]
MKAIIVDDEKHVREGLLLLADWETFGIEMILEAADGNQAMKLISEHQPEIIFTDMSMPRCDGIDLLRWINDNKASAKTIVVSGYDDFKYTRNAIMYGSFDYILKPINPTELNETLSRAVAEWGKQNSVRLTNLENNRAVFDHLLSNSLSQSSLPEQVALQLNVVGCQQYTVAVIPMAVLIHKAFKGNSEEAFKKVIETCNHYLSKENTGVAFQNMSKEEEIVLLFWGIHDVRKIVNEVLLEIKRETEIYCPIVAGNSSDQLMVAYELANNKLAKLNLLTLTDRANEDGDYDLVYLLDYSEKVKWSIHSGSIDQIDHILDEIFVTIEDRGYFTMGQLEVWEEQFSILKEHWLKEYEINYMNSIYKGIHYWDQGGRFSFSLFKEEKKKEFYELMELVYDCKYSTKKNTVQMIEEYIRNNYQKDIKLQDIADRFFLSREYISRKFKQEYQETITDYVTKIRLEKAKELLGNPFLKIYEIAETVGYQNDKYFIKVFKKREGQTPKEYRLSLQSQ